MTLAQAKHYTSYSSNRVSHTLFLISLILRANVDCIGNTEHSNVKVNAECHGIYILLAQTECNGMFFHLMLLIVKITNVTQPIRTRIFVQIYTTF